MPSLSVVRPPEQPEQSERLAVLMQEREAARAKLAKFDIFNQRLADAGSALASAKETLKASRAAEDARLREWVESGVGARPTRDGTAHARLIAVYNEAARDRDEAEAEMRVIEGANLHAIDDFNEIQNKIELTVAEGVADDALDMARTLDADLEQFQARLARILGAREALIRRSEELGGRGRVVLAANVSRLAHQLDFPPKLQISPTRGEVLLVAAEWGRKLHDPQ